MTVAKLVFQGRGKMPIMMVKSQWTIWKKSLDSIIENRKREEEQIAGFGIEFPAEIFQ